jgi:ketosteroid isomerase-like protein
MRAIERGDLEAAMARYAPDVVQVEYPNALKPKGDRRDKAALRRDAERGRMLLQRQRYEILNAVETDDELAVRVLWEGVLAVDVGPRSAGHSIQVASAMFFRFRGDTVVEQHNYDSVLPDVTTS